MINNTMKKLLKAISKLILLILGFWRNFQHFYIRLYISRRPFLLVKEAGMHNVNCRLRQEKSQPHFWQTNDTIGTHLWLGHPCLLNFKVVNIINLLIWKSTIICLIKFTFYFLFLHFEIYANTLHFHTEGSLF